MKTFIQQNALLIALSLTAAIGLTAFIGFMSWAFSLTGAVK